MRRLARLMRRIADRLDPPPQPVVTWTYTGVAPYNGPLVWLNCEALAPDDPGPIGVEQAYP